MTSVFIRASGSRGVLRHEAAQQSLISHDLNDVNGILNLRVKNTAGFDVQLMISRTRTFRRVTAGIGRLLPPINDGKNVPDEPGRGIRFVPGDVARRFRFVTSATLMRLPPEKYHYSSNCCGKIHSREKRSGLTEPAGRGRGGLCSATLSSINGKAGHGDDRPARLRGTQALWYSDQDENP